MAYNFLDLTNRVCSRLGETPLTASNFAGSYGLYAFIREAINNAIEEVNEEQWQWPFNHIYTDEALTAGECRYSLPENYSEVDEESFRIIPNATSNKFRKLKLISYDKFLERYGDEEFKTAAQGDMPEYVALTQSDEFVVAPNPNLAYQVAYEYWTFPAQLENFDDVPNIPERFRKVLLDGAMKYVATYKDNYEEEASYSKKFTKAIQSMRSKMINKNEVARSGIVFGRSANEKSR